MWIRKKGILTKVHELHTICGGTVFLKYVHGTGRGWCYSSTDEIWAEYTEHGLRPGKDERRLNQKSEVVDVISDKCQDLKGVGAEANAKDTSDSFTFLRERRLNKTSEVVDIASDKCKDLEGLATDANTEDTEDSFTLGVSDPNTGKLYINNIEWMYREREKIWENRRNIVWGGKPHEYLFQSIFCNFLSEQNLHSFFNTGSFGCE